jgi:hypothetical protein
MEFGAAAVAHLATLIPGKPEAIILSHLLRHAVGRNSAKPWVNIEAELHRHGVSLTKQGFQQGILRRTRAGDIFIGSYDRDGMAGYFIIDSVDDARLTLTCPL